MDDGKAHRFRLIAGSAAACIKEQDKGYKDNRLERTHRCLQPS